MMFPTSQSPLNQMLFIYWCAKVEKNLIRNNFSSNSQRRSSFSTIEQEVFILRIPIKYRPMFSRLRNLRKNNGVLSKTQTGSNIPWFGMSQPPILGKPVQ